MQANNKNSRREFLLLARLMFLSALPSPTNEAARKALSDLVAEAQAQGVTAETLLVPGKGWTEIIRQVHREQHDLVVVGARHVHGLQRLLFGSTSAHLVRECPCAVWVTRAGPVSDPPRLLVASDFSPVADEALRLGLGLKALVGARVDVLHAVDYPLDHLWSTGLHDPVTDTYHRKVREEAHRSLVEQLKRVANELRMESEGDLADGVQLHLADLNGLPDSAILSHITTHHIDLLIIGTVARRGLSGVMLGNTVERLLPEIPCSVLVVKPAGFHGVLDTTPEQESGE